MNTTNLRMEFFHVHLNARDVRASAAFYEKYFEFRRISPEGNQVLLRNESGFVLVLGQSPPGEDPTLPSWFHVGFRGESHEATRALYLRMQADGVAFAEPWTEYGSGPVTFYCLDPSGHQVEVRFTPKA